jgi:hypothetical protein
MLTDNSSGTLHAYDHQQWTAGFWTNYLTMLSLFPETQDIQVSQSLYRLLYEL